MPSLEEQIKSDAKKYADLIQSKFDDFNKKEKAPMLPVTVDAGNAYLRAFREANPGPHVLELTREAIAYIYKQLYDESVSNGRPMDGNLAIGFANYNPQYLSTPTDPERSDINWNEARKNKNTVMLGISTYDSSGKLNGIKPFKGTVIRSGTTISVDFYDDWHNEDP